MIRSGSGADPNFLVDRACSLGCTAVHVQHCHDNPTIAPQCLTILSTMWLDICMMIRLACS